MLSIRPLSKELQKIATEELNENPQSMHDDVTCIREWIKTQDHIKIRTNDQYLVNILRFCKYDMELTKQKIKTISAVRAKYSEFYTNRDPLLPEYQELLKLGIALPLLKTKDPVSPNVILVRSGDVNPNKMKTRTLLKYALMLKDIRLNEYDNYVIGGDQILLDCQGTSLQYTKLIDVSLVPAVQKVFEEGFPADNAGTIGVNVSRAIDITYNRLVKYLLPVEFKKRMQLYRDYKIDDLHEHFSPSMLPEEYGGTAGTIAELTAYWKEKVESYRDWFLEDEQYIATKLPSKSKSPIKWLRRRSSLQLV